jgi:hypothetical protein
MVVAGEIVVLGENHFPVTFYIKNLTRHGLCFELVPTV